MPFVEEKAKQSNLTVAVSFGLEREAAFEHAKTKVRGIGGFETFKTYQKSKVRRDLTFEHA